MDLRAQERPNDEPRRPPVTGGRRGEFVAGVEAAVPILLGYVPIGLAYGLVARAAGLTPLAAVAMSVLVYAGSAQFVASAMIAGGSAGAAIVATTLFINMRHLLFGASLARWLDGTSLGERLALSQGVTDETFVVSATEFAEGRGTPTRMLGTNVAAYLTWIASSAVGAYAGERLGDVSRFGIGFALPAMFIGLIAMQMRRASHAWVAAGAAALGVVFRLTLGPNWYLIATVMVAATAGVVITRWMAR